MSLPDAARALLALPPDRFTEERNALARALAEHGDRAADEVRKLRRPAGLAWILNRLARDRPDDVEALLRAGDRLRAGHRRALAGGGPGELRAAEEELRERARALRSAATPVLEGAGRRADPAVLSRLELLLRLLAPVPGPEREDFRQAALTGEPAPASADVGGLGVVPGGAAAAPPGAGRGRSSARAGEKKEAGLRAARKGAREARREAARQAREAKRAEAEAERRRAAARRDLARADALAARAEAEASHAEDVARRAAERARELRAAAGAARADVARRREALRDPQSSR